MGKASKKKDAMKEGDRGRETAFQSTFSQKPGENFQETPAGTPLVFPIVIILAALFAVYFNTLFNDFVYDDMTQVLENPWIKDVGFLPDIFSSGVWNFTGDIGSNYYRPLMHVIYMFSYYVFGLKPWGFHLVNVLFHAGVSVMVFLITARLMGEESDQYAVSSKPSEEASMQRPSAYSILPIFLVSPPFVAALLFAVHPIHTEAVAWVAGLPDLSFTFLYLLSFYLYMSSTAEKQVRMWHYLLSLLSFSLATLCKEPALTLPAVLVVYDYVTRRDKGRFSAHFRHYIPYVIITVGYLVLRFQALGGIATAQKRHAYLSAYQYAINVFPLFMQYIEKLLLPLNLNAFYVLHPILSLFEIRGIFSLAVTAAFILLAFVALKKDGRALLGLSIFAIPLLPVLYIPGLGENTFADRYLYLPSFGFVLLISSVIFRIRTVPKGTVIASFLLAVITALYFTGTVARNNTWKDNYILFSDTVKKSPDASIPHNMLGTALAKAGRVDEALKEYRTAVELDPYHASAHSNLGFAYVESRQLDKAITYLEAAVRIEPGNPLYRNNLAYAQSILGSAPMNAEQLDNAVEHYKALVISQPHNAMYHNMLGITYGQKGMHSEAVEQFKEAVRLAPEEPSYRRNLERASSTKKPDR
jgi:Flp pilus assembly protein TadD